MSVIPNRLNYCVIFIVCTKFENVSAARTMSYNQAGRLLESHPVKSCDFIFCGSRQWRTQEFFSGGSTNSVEDRGERERGSGGGSPLVRGSGGSCNLVQEISFHMVKFS